MTTDGYGTLVEGRTVVFRRLLPCTMELLWCYLTTKELLATWFGEGGIECRIGGRVRIDTAMNSIGGVVMEYLPFKRLVLSWNVLPNNGPSDTSVGWESIVTFELRRCGGNVLMKLTHSPVLSAYSKRTLAMWHSILDRLQASVRQQHPEPVLKRYERVWPAYDQGSSGNFEEMQKSQSDAPLSRALVPALGH
jgi:uncharacterized protein YndB with AHSA1/START domain